MKNKLTSSERRGILVVAGIALLLTGAGFVASVWSGPEPPEQLPEVKLLVAGDSAKSDPSARRRRHSEGMRLRRYRRDSVIGRQTLRRHRRPLDEPVPRRDRR